MSGETDIDDGGGDAALAGEYALGLLEGDEFLAARARVLTDRAFAAQVAAWQETLVTLADDIDPVAPPPGAWRALEDRLFGVSGPAAPRLGLWKALSGLASAAAVALALFAFLPRDTAPSALFVSDIVAADGSLGVLAVIDATAHTVRLTRTAGGARAGRALELWGIPADGSPPVSFGVMPEAETADFLVPDALLGKAVGLTLAISDEPEGGSPTGQPTGDILATGTANRI
ncbi:MAG: anti-sigma factor [Silicimonas sp.]|nr:anti-sigma factor [Silicimonas sp.]